MSKNHLSHMHVQSVDVKAINVLILINTKALPFQQTTTATPIKIFKIYTAQTLEI
jgi:hypothetical protein